MANMTLKSKAKLALPGLLSFLHDIKMLCYQAVGVVSPRSLINIWYRNVFGEDMDFENPRTLDEKVNWMKLHADMSLWTRCADKAAVRDYVREKGLEHTLNEVYGIYEKPEDVDFAALPDSFVLKSTNGGGGRTVLLVPSKKDLDCAEAIRTMRRWMRHKEGYMYYEPHYKSIPARLLAEKFLKPSEGECSLVDIKINCIEGKAHSVFLCSDRDPGKSVHYSVYDLDWNIHPECIAEKYRTEKVYPRPRSFDDMLRYSEILARGIPFVRVDWYEIDGRPVFSEMTFTPGGGFQGFYSRPFLEGMGNMIDLSKVALR